MTDRPIIFSGPMVRALLDGRKTQTRRLASRIKTLRMPPSSHGDTARLERPTIWQKVRPGDRLWVREAWQECSPDQDGNTLCYRADYDIDELRDCFTDPWRPSIHMPRWASRLTLVVTDVRRERVQDISEADARAEGVRFSGWSDLAADALPIANFAHLWDSMHKPGARWDDDPEVSVISFRCIKKNIDEVQDVKTA